jgi:hypothetical protein
MREEEVPQERSYYRGHRRACWAVGKDSHYVLAKSAGWEVERVATEQALLELEEAVETARQRVLAGELSPLAYHLAARQMTPRLAARHVGLSTWRVKRLLKPAAFARLGPELVERWSRALDVSLEDLRRVPDHPRRVFLTADERRSDG